MTDDHSSGWVDFHLYWMVYIFEVSYKMNQSHNTISSFNHEGN